MDARNPLALGVLNRHVRHDMVKRLVLCCLDPFSCATIN